MTILFCLSGSDKTTFLGMPGVRGMLEDFENNGLRWEFRNLSPDEAAAAQQREEILVVTDSVALARQLRKLDICCIGYQPAVSLENPAGASETKNSFFSGVDIVLSGWEELDAAFYLGVHKRFHGMEVMICETERLYIRESRLSDFEELYRISREPGNDDFTETMSGAFQEAKEQFQAYIAWQYDFFGFGLWTIEEKATGKIVGRCGLASIMEEGMEEGRIEIGYLITRERRRLGYAAEAVGAILPLAFHRLDCPYITAVIHKDNVASKGLAFRMGFRLLKEVKPDHPLELWVIRRDQVISEASA